MIDSFNEWIALTGIKIIIVNISIYSYFENYEFTILNENKHYLKP